MENKQKTVETPEHAKQYLSELVDIIEHGLNRGVKAGAFTDIEDVAKVSFALDQVRSLVQTSDIKMVNNGE